MEVFAWLVCFISWAVWRCRDEEEIKLTWYIIFRVWRVNGVLQFEELDAIKCECSMDALCYAKSRYRTQYGESLRAEACLVTRDIKRAQRLANQHALDDQVSNWTNADWQEFCEVPTYCGDQDKYLRTWTS